MGWLESLASSVGRSLFIASFGTLLAVAIHQSLAFVTPQRRKVVWLLLLLPFLTPSLMTGYCYRDTAMSLVHLKWAREILYGLVVMGQVIPVGVVILSFSPVAAVRISSLHIANMLKLSFVDRVKLLASSSYQYRFSAFCVLFLMSFQESDLASLMQATGWTEWMFTKHVGGLALSETIRLSLWTVVIQIPLLIPLVLWLGQGAESQNNDDLQLTSASLACRIVAALWGCVALLLVCLIPLVQMVRGSSIGIRSLIEQPSVPRELGDGILLATTTALLLIYLILPVVNWIDGKTTSALRVSILLLLLLPGCIGSLALGLILSGIFQTEPLRFSYDTPIPLVIGEVFVILPKALILVHCLGRSQSLSGLYWVSLLSKSRSFRYQQAANVLNWQLSGRRKFAMFAIIWCWAYFEVMLPSILAMPGLAPIGLVLYNNLHYGRIAALGAKLALMVAIPMIACFVFLLLRRQLTARKFA